MEFTKVEKAYLAGFFDGEGTFSISKHQQRKSPQGFNLQPFASVCSTDKKIIEHLSNKIGKGFSFWTPGRGNGKDAYILMITGTKTIIWFIDLLLPYLVLKKNVALKLKEYCFLRKDVMKLPCKQRGYNEEQMQLFSEIRLLNKKGRV